MNPIHIKKLDHIVLLVSNIAKSIHFYRDILGCPEARVSKGLFQYQAGDSMIDLVVTEHKQNAPYKTQSSQIDRNVDHFALTLSDFNKEAIIAYLKKFGIRIERSGRRFGAQGYGPSVYIKDPDGNFVELKGPPEEKEKNNN